MGSHLDDRIVVPVWTLCRLCTQGHIWPDNWDFILRTTMVTPCHSWSVLEPLIVTWSDSSSSWGPPDLHPSVLVTFNLLSHTPCGFIKYTFSNLIIMKVLNPFCLGSNTCPLAALLAAFSVQLELLNAISIEFWVCQPFCFGVKVLIITCKWFYFNSWL